MTRQTLGGVAAALAGLALAGGARAEPPPPELPPGVLVAPAPVLAPPPAFYRPSAYDVWQDYSPNAWGRWRPRVIYTPHGAFYRYNGQPYPWAGVHQQWWMPYVTD
jgi:hypothetical protein